MGDKIEEYIDNAGNSVRDDDIVVYDGSEYRVAYISHLYVNLDGGRVNWCHLPFHVGVPERKISNAPKDEQSGPVRTVTTTQIIPGQYGCVNVYDPGSKYVRINVDSAMDVEALTEAIHVLTAIRDAMQENATA